MLALVAPQRSAPSRGETWAPTGVRTGLEAGGLFERFPESPREPPNPPTLVCALFHPEHPVLFSERNWGDSISEEKALICHQRAWVTGRKQKARFLGNAKLDKS